MGGLYFLFRKMGYGHEIMIGGDFLFERNIVGVGEGRDSAIPSKRWGRAKMELECGRMKKFF